MKNNVIKFILALMIIAAPSMAFAQERGARGDRGDMEKRMKEQQDALKKDLKLSKKQIAAYDKVQEAYNKKRGELMQSMRDGGGDREGMREKMTEMSDGLNKELKEILDTKQYKKYQKIQEERRQNRGQRGMGGRGGGQRGGGR